MTEGQDREDLVHHEREILTGETFSYAVLDADEGRLLGCVYLDPRPSDDGDGNVIVSWWVIDELAGGPSSTHSIPSSHWVTDAWPFNRP